MKQMCVDCMHYVLCLADDSVYPDDVSADDCLDYLDLLMIRENSHFPVCDV